MLDICHGGIFVIGHGPMSYVGGYKFTMEVDINTFLPSDLQKHLQDIVGNILVEKVHSRKPKETLTHGLMRFCEGTYSIFLEILKK